MRISTILKQKIFGLLISKLNSKIEYIFQTETFGNHSFICSSPTELFRTVSYGEEEEALGAFLFLLNKDDVIWDIGASVGLYSVYSASLINKIIAFEPDPHINKRLKQNLALNKISNAEVYQMGIADKKGTMRLNTSGIEGNSPTLLDLNRHSEFVEVDIDSVDNLLKEGLIPPTVLKIDIEGAEAMALNGASQFLLSNKKPRLIFMEIHPDFLPDPQKDTELIFNILHQAGYKILNTKSRDIQYHLIAVI